MLHRWMSADDKRWLLERFQELAATRAHLERCDCQTSLLTIGTATEDRGLGRVSPVGRVFVAVPCSRAPPAQRR
jgi:hypothetical protein